MQTIRKDSFPEETVNRIKGLLADKLNLSVQESHFCNNNKIHSVRLEISDIPLGTNGKGTTPDYALASAYGEFMERLQAGFLIEPWIGSYGIETDSDQYVYSNLEIKDYLDNNFSELKTDYTIDDVMTFIEIRENLGCSEKIYDVFNSQTVNIPINIISAFCGSNGLCAGNTDLEAVCQGIGELFERYVVKEIMSSRFIPLMIKKELYEELPTYDMIKFIEEKGYVCKVYDCTLNGMLPVIGVLILNHSKTKKVFALGSDINFDIAIQRCLTEVFQGKILNLAFQSTMKDLINFDVLDKDWRKINPDNVGHEMLSHFLTGNGNIPLGFIFNPDFSSPQYLSVFSNNILNHENILKHYLEIIKSMNWNIYIKDYSFLGFPTYRVFIPNASSLYNTFDQYSKVNYAKARLKKELKKNDYQFSKIKHLICEINNYSDVKSYISLDNILHILNSKNTKSTHLMEMMFLFAQKDYKNLYINILKYGNREDSFLNLFLYALANGESLENLQKTIMPWNMNSSITEFLKVCSSIPDSFYTCGNCDICVERKNCHTPSLIQLYEQLKMLKKDYAEDYRFIKINKGEK